MVKPTIPQEGQIYRHFKDKTYKIVTTATHSETGEKLVVYQEMAGEERVFARPLAQFLEKLDEEQYPNASQTYRFEPVEEKKKVLLSGDFKYEGEHSLEEDKKEKAQEYLIQFLDADSYSEKLMILKDRQEYWTDTLLTTMSVSLDLYENEGTTDEKFEDLKRCLMTKQRFECSRLR